ncbi:hypothetical protein BWI75_03650 [Gloeocapsopsis sp. AAB1 = 1H9]|uniref:Uncharacterized protein n=1 Tax=Gloeocapsopsis dulcis AAB1 = 1H9 TaxID=1433147 RepID=A0A6N8FU55_9CHRO|nr:hypothetical protein [Gloeocapsopsis dulcis AAB1 = 1H9]
MANNFKILDADLLHKDAVVSFFKSMFKVGELASLSSDIFCNSGLKELNNRLNAWGKGVIPSGNNNEWINNGK